MSRDEIRRTLLDLRVAVDDADAITADMLRIPRRRELGPALHRKQYVEARGKITTAIAYLMRVAGDDVPTEPEGGASSTH